MRSRLVIAVASALAAGSLAVQAQQGPVSNSRSMFDPTAWAPPATDRGR